MIRFVLIMLINLAGLAYCSYICFDHWDSEHSLSLTLLPVLFFMAFSTARTFTKERRKLRGV